MGKNKKLFSKQVEKKHIIYRFFGIKLAVKNPDYVDLLEQETKNAIKIQDDYDLSALKSAQKLILFLTPSGVKICGGVMSIFSLCETSRELNPDSVCILSTYPNDEYTYATNDKFLNNEQIYRFSQIVDNCKALKKLIIHIPDYYAKEFYSDLKKKDIKFLKSIKNVQLNIMNQNIELMPDIQVIKKLYKVTDNITQTIAHHRYATQEICNKWQIPTHLFSCHLNILDGEYATDKKENIILYSPDSCKDRDEVISLLENNLPEYKIIKIEKLKFEEFKKLVAKSLFTISFGEGFDGYLLQPALLGSLGVAVYNDTFFPNKSWMDLDNIYSSWDDLKVDIVKLCRKLENDPIYYKNLSLLNKQKHNELYDKDKYIDNLKRFYQKQYDYYPQEDRQ